MFSVEADVLNPNHPGPGKYPEVLLLEDSYVSVAEFLASVPDYEDEKDYLGPFLHGGNRVHVAGPIGHGKTSFLLEAVGAAVRGTDFLGFAGKGGLRALYVDLEMSAPLLAQAVRDARLEGADGFHLMHRPDGLRIDKSPEDRRLLADAAAGFDLLVIDPFYKLMEQEMEHTSTRGIIDTLDEIRTSCPGLCVLIGFHSQEVSDMELGYISGFKNHHRAADMVVMFKRVEGNTSKIRWVKNRSPKLAVKHGEFWTLEWERGRGFKRSDGATLRHTDEVEALFG